MVEFEGKLIIIEQQTGLYRVSTNGTTWEQPVSFSNETLSINKVVVGNGWIVGVNAMAGNSSIFAAQSDLNFQKYVIPNSTEILTDIAFGEGKFIVVGTTGKVISFDVPGNWTVENYGFAGDIQGINFFAD
jgi:hypothetical protein